MKRAASPAPSDRPAKLARTDAPDAFDPANERDASLLQQSLDPNGFISGTIAMVYPPIRDIRKVQLTCGGGWSLAVEIRGPIVRTLVLKMKTTVKIALRNASVESVKRSSAHSHLPFRLIFENGVLLQNGDGVVVDSWAANSHEQAEQEQTAFLASHGNISESASIVVAVTQLSGVQSPEITDTSGTPTSPLTTPKALVRQRAPEVLVPSSHESEHSSSENVETTEENPSGSERTAGQPHLRRFRKRETRRSERGTLHERKDRDAPASVPRPLSPVKTLPVAGPSTPRRMIAVSAWPVNAKTPDGQMHEYLPLRIVKSLPIHRRVSIIGVAAASSQPKQTRSGEFSRVLHVTDESLDPGDYFFVQCFSKDQGVLPNVKEGQVILLRQIKLIEWQGHKRGIGYKDAFSWVGFDAELGVHFVLDPELPRLPGAQQFPFVQPAHEEIARFVQLSDWWRSQEGIKVAIPAPAPPRRRVLIKDMQPKVFCDCVAEVIRIFHDVSYTVVYVTDFTTHPFNRDLGELDCPSPSGKHTLKLVLWDVQKDTPITAGPESYYLIRNIRPHVDKDGFLEGNLSGAGEYFTPLEVTDPEAAELVQRRKAYWLQARHSSPIALAERKIVNCFHMQQPLYTIPDVLLSDLKHAKFRVRGQVIDFFPHAVADFVITYCTKCREFIEEPKQRSCLLCGDDQGKNRSFRYRFCLRIIDESGQWMDVNVEGEAAMIFLARLKAQDLHEDDGALRTVKDRLGLILGNLIEVHDRLDKDELVEPELGPTFDFCVQSWEMENRQRGYNLFGCMIALPP